MDIAAVFVNSGPRPAVPAVGRVKFELGKEAEVITGMEIEMGHHPVHDVSIVVLRPGAKHPIVEILVFDSVFKSQREVFLWVFAQRNVLRRVEKVRARRRVCKKTPILFCRERIQGGTCRVWSRTKWTRIWSLRPRRHRRERYEKSDQQKIPMAYIFQETPAN
jgi:hypothetical protein